MIAIIEELKLETVNFIAHSVSSMIGALGAIQRPELFENLVMIGPSPSYINDGEYLGGFERSDIEDLLEMLDNNHSGWSAMMAPIIMENPKQPELATELEASFCRTDPIHAQHFARVIFLSDNRADLLNLHSRTLSYSPANGSDSSLPDFFTALQEELGLKLESHKVPVNFVIVDHVERTPDEN